MESTQDKVGWVTIAFILGIVLGITLILWADSATGVTDPPEDKYTVQELTDAIATREANYSERALELEASK